MLRIRTIFFFAAGLSLLWNPDPGQGESSPAANNLATVDSRKCEVYDENLTICSFEDNLRRTDNNVAVMRAWTAATLRENILSILGYMLHTANITLSSDVYTSLYLLYKEIQRNNVRVMELIPRLKNIVKNKRVPQILNLFKSMYATAPSYFKSALKEVIKDFSKHKELARSLSSEVIDNQRINLFFNIDKRLLPLLRYKNTTKKRNRAIESAYGKEFAKFYVKIRDGHVPLTQPVLGALMLNMKWPPLSPAEIEDFRFLVDNLRYSNLTGWKPNPDGAVPCCYGAKDPYTLVNICLSTIPYSIPVQSKLKDIVASLMPKLIEPQNIAVNPYYKQMEPFLGHRIFDIDLLLDEFSGDYGLPDLSPLKVTGTEDFLELRLALEGFVRFNYNRPEDLLFAFIRRVMNRVPLPDKKRDLVTKAYTILRQRHLENLHDKTVPKMRTKRDVINITNYEEPFAKSLLRNLVIWKGFFEPLICKNGVCSSEISDILPFVDIDDILRRVKANFTPCDEDYSPSSLLTWTEQLGRPASIVSPELIRDVSAILVEIFNDNDIMNQVNMEILRRQNFLLANINYYQLPKQEIKTRGDQIHQILKAMLTVKKVQARPLVFYEVIRLLCVLIKNCTNDALTKLADDLWLDEPPTRSSIEDFLKGVNHRIAQLFHEQQFSEVLSGIEPEDYSTNRMVLLAMFRRLLVLDAVRNDERIFNEIVRLLHAIHKPSVDFTGLLKTIAIDDVNDVKFVLLISRIITYPSIFYNMDVDFNIGAYRTDGRIMNTILIKIATAAREKNDVPLQQIIKKIISKVDCSSNYTEVVRSIRNGVTTDVVNFNNVLFGALVKVNPDILNVVRNMSKWNQVIFVPEYYVRKMNLSLYDTRAEFMDAFYDTVIQSVDHNVAILKKNIQFLRNAILRTGRGTAPVDYGLI